MKIALYRSAPTFVCNLQHVRQNIDCNRASQLMLQLVGQALLKLQQPFWVVFDIFPEIRKGNAFLVLLLFQFRQTVFYFVSGVPDRLRKHSSRLPGIFKRRQGMRKHLMVFRRKNRICLQDALGRILHRQKIFFRFLLQYRTAQVIQPKRFLFDFLSQGSHFPMQLFPFIQQGLFPAAQLLLLLKYAALRTSQFKLAPAVLFLRDLRCDFPDPLLGGG